MNVIIGESRLENVKLVDKIAILPTVEFVQVRIDEICSNLLYKDVEEINVHSIKNIISMIYYPIVLLDKDTWRFIKTINILDNICNLVDSWLDLKSEEKILWLFNEFKSIFDNELEEIELSEKEKEKYLKAIVINIPILENKFIEYYLWEERYTYDLVKMLSFKNRLIDIFKAVSDNSNWNISIVFNKSNQWENDYYIDFDLDSYLWDKLYIPNILEDVIRDLSFNSRKYSSPWSDICIKISQSKNKLIIIISDEWIWIPLLEQEEVFKKWKRWSNSCSKRWFGLWLTKAAYVVNKLMWQMELKSKEDIWTSIKITIPIDISNS